MCFFLSIVTCDLSRWLRGDDVKTGFRQFAEASRETGLASLTGDERADDNPSTRRSVAVLKQALHKELLSTGKLPCTDVSTDDPIFVAFLDNAAKAAKMMPLDEETRSLREVAILRKHGCAYLSDPNLWRLGPVTARLGQDARVRRT